MLLNGLKDQLYKNNVQETKAKDINNKSININKTKKSRKKRRTPPEK